MDRQIAREVKRVSLYRECKHEYVDYIIPDPVDKRRKLRPSVTTVFGKDYTLHYCKNCGVGKLL